MSQILPGVIAEHQSCEGESDPKGISNGHLRSNGNGNISELNGPLALLQQNWDASPGLKSSDSQVPHSCSVPPVPSPSNCSALTTPGNSRRASLLIAKNVTKNLDEKLHSADQARRFDRELEQTLARYDFVIRDAGLASQRSCKFPFYAAFTKINAQASGCGAFVCSMFSREARCRDMLMAVVAIVSCIISPLQHTFLEPHEYINLCAVVECLWGVCLLWGIRFSVLESHFENFQPTAIIQHHLRDWRFWLDLTTLICVLLSLQASPTSAMALGMTTFARVWHWMWIPGSLRQTWERLDVQFVKLLRFLLLTLLLIHMIACLWYFTCMHSAGSFELHMEMTLQASGGQFRPNHERVNHYLFAYREVAMMMISESRVVNSNAELVFSIVMAILGCMLISVLLAEVVQLIRRRALLEDLRCEQLAHVSMGASSLKLPGALRRRIIEYVRFLQEVHDRRTMQILFENLSPTLVLELRLTLFHDLIANAPFFHGAPANVVKQLVMSLKDCFYQPGDFIVRKGEIASEMYFIKSGTCDVIPELNLTSVQKLSCGDCFGEIAMLKDDTSFRTAWVRARDFVHLAMLVKNDMAMVIAALPQQQKQLEERRQKFLSNVHLSSRSDQDHDIPKVEQAERARSPDSGDIEPKAGKNAKKNAFSKKVSIPVTSAKVTSDGSDGSNEEHGGYSVERGSRKSTMKSVTSKKSIEGLVRKLLPKTLERRNSRDSVGTTKSMYSAVVPDSDSNESSRFASPRTTGRQTEETEAVQQALEEMSVQGTWFSSNVGTSKFSEHRNSGAGADLELQRMRIEMERIHMEVAVVKQDLSGRVDGLSSQIDKLTDLVSRALLLQDKG
eukprot:gnl/MRDRNA2_/MRDRNA2_107116_c0_seq1.p1 gnl/MRDRNA2_/MRDRNA2_107116_c0~~gnl/MRDRNA2_/MRDRNA2_107116_c0_seq1.p1  ORF type:complete len:845 (-),score=119.44 gnl/MRDRNA2_/MRDRNA2_107116_c0_seq1:63-2597(-)